MPVMDHTMLIIYTVHIHMCIYIYTLYILNGEYATRYFSSGVLEPKVGVATSENPISRHPSCTEAGIFLS